jgi:Fur family ferric uptake transcriptional regulator
MTSTDPSRLRHTRQREAVGAIMAALDEFRTAQEVHELLREGSATVGLATVYRTLARMAADGEIDSIRTPDGVAAYRRCSAGHHHHLVCRQCGRTVEVTPPDLEVWAQRVAAEHGFTDLDHELELFGRCPDCR